ncbi:hypothetical protein [Xenorhabdus sp. TH1]|uniref:hypothetical protein n=1 Tax=Xenorhabdus sp. TH1 TaxID=3130166 RepID=UPI0030D05185
MKTYICKDLHKSSPFDVLMPFCSDMEVSAYIGFNLLVMTYGRTMTLEQVCYELKYTERYVKKALYTKDHKLGESLRSARVHDNKNKLFLTEKICNTIYSEKN